MFLADGDVAHSAYIEDTLGLINAFGLVPLYFSKGNSILGDCTFGDQAFGETTGINKFKNILLANPLNLFAPGASGRFEIYGNIGINETANYTCLLYTSPSPRDS